MAGYFVRRLTASLFAVWGVATLTFILLRVTANPASLLAGEQATEEQLQQISARLGLDEPLFVQYVKFLGGIVTGDFGDSYRSNEPALQIVIARLPNSLQLAIVAFVIAVFLAIPLATASAVWRNSPVDYVASLVSFLGFSIPTFWLGAMAIIVFSVQLGWFPTSGSGTWQHLVLPAATLATWPLGQFTRLFRSELLSVFQEDYMRTARAKGVSESRLVVGHAMRNAFLPLLTLMGISFASLMGGAIVTETVFAWPGVGRLVVESTLNRDFPIIQTVVILLASGFVAINFLVDILYGVLDPRIKLT